MKKIIPLLLFISLCFTPFYGEENKSTFDLEKFKADRMEFLIKEVCLTTEEAAQLFPLYNEMQSKRYNAMKMTKNKAKELRKSINPSSEDCIKMVDELLDKQNEDATVEKAYYQRFKKILSPQKLLKFKLADLQYSREMMRRRDQFRLIPNMLK